MDKYIIRTKRTTISTTNVGGLNESQVDINMDEEPQVDTNAGISNEPQIDMNVGGPSESQNIDNNVGGSSSKRARMETISEEDIVSDPALRKPINEYDPRFRDDVRREYVVKGSCQPISYDFKRSQFGKTSRCFQIEWFKKWEWLEFSISKDAAFCFWCYLFRGEIGKRNGDDVFVKTGFRNWKKGCDKFKEHVGVVGSVHNDARTLFFAFKDQRQSLTRKVILGKQVLEEEYRIRLTAMVDVARLLINQGLPFRGHDETSSSRNKGNFLEVLDWYSSRNLEVEKVVKENAPKNHQLTSHSIQKQIISACASETINVIISDIGDKFFSLLVDEARDSSVKEQMAIVLRYVNNHGFVMERFLGVVHVVDTTALSLKRGIDEFFARHGLSISKLRGQGYDGASNMRGELNGLKTLILNENPSARYIHCFAHQLQLVVVAVSQNNRFVSDFFDYMCIITNLVGASCKRKDEFRQKQHQNMVERLESGEIASGRGLNQESSLTRPGATRWGSHYTTIVRLLSMWLPTTEVLENIYDDGQDVKARSKAGSLAQKMENYLFVFVAHLMVLVLGITNILSQVLQQKDLDIIEAMSLVQSAKEKLQDLRENGWDELLEDVNNFCAKNDIIIPNMEDDAPVIFRRRATTTYYHRFRVDIFCQVIDQIGTEMESRFSETSTEVLTCVACLDPKDSFCHFSESKLLRLAELYPQDFSGCDLMELKAQLMLWIHEMRQNDKFSNLQNTGALAKKMVEVGIHGAFHLVYRLIELALVLPVATATVERAFSAMSIIKSDLRNKMGDEFLTDSLVCYVEKDIFRSIDNEVILQYFQTMRTRRMDLPPL